ncbi:hypothetical protein IWQ60_004636 [Tieghemiomyces parasiticus]|uniref:Uncharacterized protein n=1 Tax=Tieghemiomyces parasiticus TaxID=78921 RepID=A0A9W8AFJ4_9FUNG|nr:hypothetical protein IWQ60_004636 [Tieghemiomyces parasiticus]
MRYPAFLRPFEYLLTWAQTPFRQLFLAAVINLCQNAAWNAVLGVGGGGLMDSSISAKANVAGSIAGGVSGFVLGGVINYLGVRNTILLQSLMYASFMASFVLYAYWPVAFPVIFTGALKGLGLPFAYGVQSTMMTAYPRDHRRGHYLSTFYLISSINGILGGGVTLALNIGSTSRALGLTTYYVATVVAVIPLFLALFLVQPHKLCKADGASIVVPKFRGWVTETRLFLTVLGCLPLILLVPYSLVTQCYYAYQFNAFNFYLFTIRTRAINCMIYYASSLVASYAFGWFLDHTFKHAPRTRGLVALGTMLTMALGAYIGAYFIQMQPRLALNLPAQSSPTLASPAVDQSLIDITNYAAYIAPLVVFILWGALDAMFNAFLIWMLSLLFPATDTFTHQLGYLVVFRSVGLTVGWELDAVRMSLHTQNLVMIGTTVVGCLVAAGVLIYYVRPTKDDVSECESDATSFPTSDTLADTLLPKGSTYGTTDPLLHGAVKAIDE